MTSLTRDERRVFYSLSEGSEIFPLSWMLRMDQADTDVPFMHDLARFGLVYDEEFEDQDPRLPIGLTVAKASDLGVMMVGVNCAACHVGQVHYQGERLLIDGAPSQFDIERFYRELIASAVSTLKRPRKLIRMLGEEALPPRFDFQGFDHAVIGDAAAKIALPDLDELKSRGPVGNRMASHVESTIRQAEEEFERNYNAGEMDYVTSVLVEGDTRVGRLDKAQTAQLEALAEYAKTATGTFQLEFMLDKSTLAETQTSLRRKVELLLARIKFLRAVSTRDGKDDTPALYGRVDAFGFARNFLFGRKPYFTANVAPVSYPHLWDFREVRWLHWNGNTDAVLARNIGQALGVGGLVHLGPRNKYHTSVSLRNLHVLEGLAGQLKRPDWPSQFPPIDLVKKERGKAVYSEQGCDGCHDKAEPNTGPKEYDARLLKSMPNHQRTDPMHAESFAAPLRTSAGTTAFHTELKELLARVEDKYVADHAVSTEERAEWHRGRPKSEWKAPLGYPARPLTGVWATAPYLHNNSVPTLFSLLCAPERRPVTFYVGNREYDPVEVGYAYQRQVLHSRLYDTRLRGNSNRGHIYFRRQADQTAEAALEDCWSLLEYLKSR